MEPATTVIIEPCGDAGMIIQSVKDIVYSNSVDTDSNNGLEEKFLILTNTSEYNNRHQVALIEATNINSMEPAENSMTFTELCRVCANTSNHMIPIFDGEGVQHDLCTKIHKYLPIHITENDILPSHICYHCASTLLAWHDLLEGCVNAQQKLLQMQAKLNSQEEDKLVSMVAECTKTADVMKDIQVMESDVNEIPSLSERPIERDNDATGKQNATDDERSCNVATGYKIFVHMQNKSPKIARDLSDGLKDDFNGAWTLDNDDISLEYNDVTGSQSVENLQSEDTTIINNINIKAKCSICLIEFPDIQLLHLHVKTHKMWSSQKSYQCVECNKCFRLKDSLVRHLRIHNNERSFTCHVCGKQFRDSGGLSRHLNDVHAKRKPFSCEICNKNFASNATRNDHRRTHTGERPYTCHLCGKKFKSRACLYIHSKVHTNDFPHPCLLCNKKFRRRQELVCHMTTHTGEKNFICDVCEKRFRIKSELVRHTRTHSDEKPFVCNKCGLRFRQRRYLNSHIKSRHSQLN